MNIQYRSIGVVHSPFTEPNGMPIQPLGATGVKGTVEIFPEFAEGLKDVEGFSHIILLYHFHRCVGSELLVVPFMDTKLRGVFATRAPKRPNPLGLSVVRLLKIEGRNVRVENVDILDGTPLLDLKPYVPEFDEPTDVRTGWLEGLGGTASGRKSDKRFTEGSNEHGESDPF